MKLLVNLMLKSLLYHESAVVMDIYSLCGSNLELPITLEIRKSIVQKILSKLSELQGLMQMLFMLQV